MKNINFKEYLKDEAGSQDESLSWGFPRYVLLFATFLLGALIQLSIGGSFQTLLSMGMYLTCYTFAILFLQFKGANVMNKKIKNVIWLIRWWLIIILASHSLIFLSL